MSAVYVIRNLLNGKLYVGKADNPDRRWREHVRTALKPRRSRSLIATAIAKYGAAAFEFRVVREYPTSEEALAEEKRLIEELGTIGDCGYNLCKGGRGGGARGRQMPDSQKAKLSAYRLGTKQSPTTRARLVASMQGHVLAEETKEKIREKQTGKIYSAEVCEKRSASNKLVWADPEFRRRRKEAHSAAMNRPGVRESVRLGNQRRWPPVERQRSA